MPISAPAAQNALSVYALDSSRDTVYEKSNGVSGAVREPAWKLGNQSRESVAKAPPKRREFAGTWPILADSDGLCGPPPACGTLADASQMALRLGLPKDLKTLICKQMAGKTVGCQASPPLLASGKRAGKLDCQPTKI